MPAHPAHHAIARQWELLRVVPRRGPGCSATVLTERLRDLGFSVDLRTVQRDLLSLSSLFPLTCAEDSKPYLWRWVEGAALDVPAIDLGDAVSLKLMEAFLKPLLPASIVQALESRFLLAERKLAELAGSSAASRWLEKVHVVQPALGLMPPRIDADVMARVQEALFADEQLQLDYRSINAAAPRAMRVHPLALVQRGAVSYLVCTIGEYRDVRLLAVHRISDARRTGEPAQPLPGFSLQTYLASGALEFGDGDTPPIQLSAWIRPELARHLEETPLSADMMLTPEGDGFALSATVRDTWQLYWWLMSMGAQITIRRPDTLRDRIRRAHEVAAAAYSA